MNQNIVVAEGEHDRLLLHSLLNIDKQPASVRVVAAGGFSAADSLARSLLIKGEMNVALVVDADSNDPSLVEERKKFLQQSLGEVPTHSKWRVFVIVPEVESLLFRDRAVLESIVGHSVSDANLIRGQYEPKKVLSELLGRKSWADMFNKALPILDLDSIRTSPEIKGLYDFVHASNGRRTAIRAISFEEA